MFCALLLCVVCAIVKIEATCNYIIYDDSIYAPDVCFYDSSSGYYKEATCVSSTKATITTYIGNECTSDGSDTVTVSEFDCSGQSCYAEVKYGTDDCSDVISAIPFDLCDNGKKLSCSGYSLYEHSDCYYSPYRTYELDTCYDFDSAGFYQGYYDATGYCTSAAQSLFNQFNILFFNIILIAMVYFNN